LIELNPPPEHGPEAIDEALDLQKYLAAIESAPDLSLSDIEITSDNIKSLRDEFAFEAINVLTEYGGEHFKRYKKCEYISPFISFLNAQSVDAVNHESRPLIQPLLPLRVTQAYPLPTMHIEQASASGNATVIEELRRVTKLDTSELFKRRLCIVTGDLLTISRILSIRDVRTLYMQTPVHVKDTHESLRYLVPFCGLFHTRIAAVTAILHTHFGKPNARPKDAPTSLWRHNELLKRKNIPIQQSPIGTSTTRLLGPKMY
jgi:hypothetical protein